MDSKASFTVKIGNVNVGIVNNSDFAKDFCKDYLTLEKPDFCVFAEKDKVLKQMANTTEHTTYEYSEFLCIYREIAEKLPLFNRFLFHGACIEYKGNGYLFTAPSGTGKTTHISLWRKYLKGKIDIVNGDKPIIGIENGKVYCYGTPWAGKENIHRNVFVPLKAIVFINRGLKNKIEKTSLDKTVLNVLKQTYKPVDKQALNKTFDLINGINGVEIFNLYCDMTEEAVKVSFEGITKDKYERQTN